MPKEDEEYERPIEWKMLIPKKVSPDRPGRILQTWVRTRSQTACARYFKLTRALNLGGSLKSRMQERL